MHEQPLGHRPGDRELLESWTRSSAIRAGLAQRARTVLLAGRDQPATEQTRTINALTALSAASTSASMPGRPSASLRMSLMGWPATSRAATDLLAGDLQDALSLLEPLTKPVVLPSTIAEGDQSRMEQ